MIIKNVRFTIFLSFSIMIFCIGLKFLFPIENVLSKNIKLLIDTVIAIFLYFQLF